MLRTVSENTLLVTVVGTGVGATAVVVSVLAIVASGMNSRLSALGSELGRRIDKTNDRIDALRGEFDAFRRELREDHAALDARLRGVEIGFAKVDQRLATVERAILPQAPPA